MTTTSKINYQKGSRSHFGLCPVPQKLMWALPPSGNHRAIIPASDSFFLSHRLLLFLISGKANSGWLHCSNFKPILACALSHKSWCGLFPIRKSPCHNFTARFLFPINIIPFPLARTSPIWLQVRLLRPPFFLGRRKCDISKESFAAPSFLDMLITKSHP